MKLICMQNLFLKARNIKRWSGLSCRLKTTVSDMDKKKYIAVCQMTSTNEKESNLYTCKALIESAKRQQALMVFLPEGCDYLGESKEETLALAEPLDGPLMKQFCHLAKSNQIWLSLGGIHEKANNKVCNAHVIVDNDGNIVSVYRKTHLFDVDIPEKGVRFRESDYVNAGNLIVTPSCTPVGKVGLGICYDLRFPELSLALTEMGAELLTYPSAFTVATGAVHWEVLLKSRAIESQCYVVAAAQTGAHNKKRTSWGHAMVVDPWGTVTAQCQEGTNLAITEINLEYLYNTRASMPVLKHRRNDLYPKLASVERAELESTEQTTYKFGEDSIPVECIFYKTALTIAFTNRKCVVPGHVLVAPIRVAEKVAELTSEEVADMFRVVQKVQKVLEIVHNVSSSTISVQDGKDAGQTVHHVHAHVLPRKPGDFVRNDDIYFELQDNDKADRQQWRPVKEMAIEAQILERHF